MHMPAIATVLQTQANHPRKQVPNKRGMCLSRLKNQPLLLLGLLHVSLELLQRLLPPGMQEDNLAATATAKCGSMRTSLHALHGATADTVLSPAEGQHSAAAVLMLSCSQEHSAAACLHASAAGLAAHPR
jgi:hypothetical protein